LSNLILEINERVTQEGIQNAATAAATSSPGSAHVDVSTSTATVAAAAAAALPINSAGGSSGGNVQDEDCAAALYHLRDLCDAGDSMDIIKPPRSVEVPKLSTSSSPPATAYAGVVLFKTPNPKWRTGSLETPAPPPVFTATGSASSLQLVAYSCCFLLVRLPQQTTDLLVYINVPHEEFEKSGDSEGLAEEEAMASRLLDEFERTLEVRDWDLFG
jgi:hypothetical protein